ncbi:MAG: hypothetical protein DLM50_03120 [Candidatus Meridianibacter frigidus]|nr:MAG: hypothetical protein DLM50_03120 [Candidatus Eremiobacteraeota bacterium]
MAVTTRMLKKGYLNVRNFVAHLLLGALFALCGVGAAKADTTSTPSPKPAPTADVIKISGNARAFYFTRTNKFNCDSAGVGAGSIPQCNAAAFNVGGKLQAEYQFGTSPWIIGATYFAAEPFGANGNNPGFNPRVDNTLPGYALSLLGEYYLQYKNKYVNAQTGKELINTPWAGPSDSRIVPTVYQGTLLQGSVTRNLTLGAMYMARFRHRVTSTFDSNTLLTSCATVNPTGKVPGVVGPPFPAPPVAGNIPVPGDPCNPQRTTKGFLLFWGSQKLGANATLNLYNYNIYDLINLTHADIKYNYAPKSPMNPFVAAQYIAENDTGAAYLGTVHNHTFGMQISASFGKNVDLAFSLNAMPHELYVTTKCGLGPGGVFGGIKGGAVAGAPAGTIYCYGGSVASPYSDSYATDPLYTTTISQGLADVHKPGDAQKISGTFQTSNHRFKAIVAKAWYGYSLPVSGGTDARQELNVDVQYFFNPVDPKKTYHGLSIRHRYADRTQTGSPFDFKYNRTQLEFSF